MKVGIIGTSGMVGPRHIAGWQKLNINWEGFTREDGDWTRFMEREDITHIDIASPIYLHKPMLTYAAMLEKPVICEKPLGLNIREGIEIINEVASAPKPVAIIYQFRFNPKIQQLKEELAGGKYGEIRMVTVTYFRWKAGEYFKGWRASKTEAGGGVVLNVTIHYLDLMQWLFGFPTSIHGHITTMEKGIDVEDTAVATMQFPNGAVGSYVVSSHVDPQYHMEMGVYGTKGHTRIELRENEYHAENFKAFLDDRDFVTPVEALKSLKMVEAIYERRH